MIARLPIEIPEQELNEFCRRNHIRRLSFFGSVVRDDFGPESDIDVLVEFQRENIPGLISFAGMEIELSELLGRKVDLNTPGFFESPLRERIQREAVLHYGEQD